jgi:hypothetical protein
MMPILVQLYGHFFLGGDRFRYLSEANVRNVFLNTLFLVEFRRCLFAKGVDPVNMLTHSVGMVGGLHFDLFDAISKYFPAGQLASWPAGWPAGQPASWPASQLASW